MKPRDRYILVTDQHGFFSTTTNSFMPATHRVLFDRDGKVHGYENISRDRSVLNYLINAIMTQPAHGEWPEKGFSWQEKITVEGLI